MRMTCFSIFLTLFFSSNLYGEPTMNTAIDTLVFSTDAASLSNSAREITRVYDTALSGDISAIEANDQLFNVINSDPAASAAIYLAARQNLPLRAKDGGELMSVDTLDLVDAIRQKATHFSDVITPVVYGESNVDKYLKQMVSINIKLLSLDTNLISNKRALIDNFKQYQTIVGILEEELGYVDYDALHSAEYFWPNSDAYQGSYNFINLFRTSEADREKSQKFEALFETLSPNEQLAAYAWVYDANFETYLAVSALPSDLPPWITSRNLRELHRSINDTIMSEFQTKETDMYEN